MITLEASALAAAMAHASAIPHARNTMPILAHARLIARDGMLEITTSDLDIQFQTSIPLTQAGELAVAVDASRITDLAKAAAPGAQISMAIDNGQLIVKSGRSRWRLNFMAAGDFPDASRAVDGKIGIEVPGNVLAAALSRVAWSASTEITRPYLNGVFFNGQDGPLALAATDGHTLIELETEWQWPDDAPQIILPNKMVSLICRLIGKGTGDVLVNWTARAMEVSIGNSILLGKTIEGQFPDYRRIIPAESHTTLLDPGDVRDALRRVLLVAEGKTRIIRLERAANKITLSSLSPEHGEATEEIPAEVDAAGFGVVGFNAAYLASALEHLGGDTLRIDQDTPGSPGLFRRQPADKARVVIMPCRA